jgi:hypothetical protein
MQCGNKTDQCPNCQKYIRRAIFAYHYENDCANLDEPDNPTPPTRISSTQRPSSNISKPVSKNNDFIDDDQENNNESTTTNDQLDKLQRISSATSRNSSYFLYSSSTLMLFFCLQRKSNRYQRM